MITTYTFISRIEMTKKSTIVYASRIEMTKKSTMVKKSIIHGSLILMTKKSMQQAYHLMYQGCGRGREIKILRLCILTN